MTRIFLDTEFTNIHIDNPELISLGLAAETGETFYLERVNIDTNSCTPFVQNTILPLLFTGTYQVHDHLFILQLNNWLKQFNDIQILVDYNLDVRLMMNLLHTKPANISGAYNILSYITEVSKTLWFNHYPNHYQEVAKNIQNKFLFFTTEWYRIHDLPPHHALYDAQANCYGFLEMEKLFQYSFEDILGRKVF